MIKTLTNVLKLDKEKFASVPDWHDESLKRSEIKRFSDF